MKTSAVTPELMAQTVKAVSRSSLFSPLNEQQLATVVSKAEMVQAGPGESVMEEGTDSDCFFVILRGEAIVYVGAAGGDETEVGRLGSPEVFGEMGLLRGTKRSATVRAGDGLVLVKFDSKTFQLLFEKVPGFGMGICRALADRLDASSRKIPMASAETLERPDEATLGILPMAFLQRHRVLPMKHQGSSLTIGFVGEATPAILNAIRKLVPGAQLQPVAIPASLFESTLSSRMGKEAWEDPGMPKAAPAPTKSAAVSASGSAPALDKLLHRMVEEGASDLHLCGSQQPRWRIDGEIRAIMDAPVMGVESVLELMSPIMPTDN
ncbi:MAG: cyclic nucleotide-binding domain-containing protein, partial [Myxococcota bacterium]|nr:cyclic nucleotide-binding domain-containing protein [Myxococcota bacterium]